MTKLKLDWKALDEIRQSKGAPLRTINHSVEDEVKLVSYDFNDRLPVDGLNATLELMMLTDLQIGAKGFQRARFLTYRDWLLSKPNRFVFLGGDLVNANTILSKGRPHEDIGEPIDQIDLACELLGPLAEEERLLGYVGGNHERRTLATYGDCGRLIASELKVPYSRGVQLIDIAYGEHRPFKVSLWHGGGSARTKGAKAQMLHRFMSQADSQVYLCGHLHDVVVLMDWRQERKGKKIKLQKIAGIMSSSFLQYWNSYAEVSAMSPTDTVMGRVVLEPNGHWEVTLK
jgi:hypothetical protein